MCQPIGCPAKVVGLLVLICGDKLFSYDFLVGCRAADLLLAVDDCASSTSHRPHIGCQFSVVMGFRLSLLEGVASRVLGLRWWTETRAMDVDNDVYCSGPGYGPENSHIQIDMACSKGREEGSSTKNEHNMMQ